MFSIYFSGTDGAMYNESGEQISIDDLIIIYEKNGGKVKRSCELREVILLNDVGFEKKIEECEVITFTP